MNIQKININKLNHNYNESILTSARKKFSGKIKNANTEILPVVTVPLVAYMATVKKTMNDLENNKAIEQANNYKPNNVTWNEQQSRKELKSLGITQKSEQDRFITEKGTIKQHDLDKYKQKHSISHKGAPDDLDAHETTLDADITGDPPQIYDENKVLSGLSAESREMLDEINNTDMSLPPDLQEILDMPSVDTPEGFINTIFGDLPEGMSVDEDIWSMLKGIANEILDIGDWF